MSKEHTAAITAPHTISDAFSTLSASRRPAHWLCAAGIVLAGSALAAVCARVAVPLFFTPVPLSLAPFAVLLLGLLLTPRMAAATFAAYLAEGAAGLPVFAPSHCPSGLAHLLGPTGGYLLAYPLAAALISFLYRRIRTRFRHGIRVRGCRRSCILSCGALWSGVLPHLMARRQCPRPCFRSCPAMRSKLPLPPPWLPAAVRLRHTT